MDFHDISIWFGNLPRPVEAAAEAARKRDAQLTKPGGALGRLEELAVWCAAWQGRHPPRLDEISILVFAGNHGITARGVSAFPPEVTVQMVANFTAGGAAINQLARTFGATLEAIDLDLDRPTRDFTVDAAMDAAECAAAFSVGFDAVRQGLDLLIVGEMGIGNTTTAAALACALFGGDASDWTGPGTGVDRAGVAKKSAAVAEAMAFHGEALSTPMEALRRVGGREIAAIAGAILSARHKRIPVILDGFVTCAAAAVLEKGAKGALDHCVAGHLSAEPGHRRLLERLGKEPLLSLGMRLGEASGAAVALGVLKAALATHNGMATFDEAAVSRKDD